MDTRKGIPRSLQKPTQHITDLRDPLYLKSDLLEAIETCPLRLATDRGHDLHVLLVIGLDLHVPSEIVHVNTDTGLGPRFRVTTGLGQGLPDTLQDQYRQFTTAKSNVLAQKVLILLFVRLVKMIMGTLTTISIISLANLIL